LTNIGASNTETPRFLRGIPKKTESSPFPIQLFINGPQVNFVLLTTVSPHLVRGLLLKYPALFLPPSRPPNGRTTVIAAMKAATRLKMGRKDGNEILRVA